MSNTIDYSDQQKIFNPDKFAWPVHLIGAGGINNLVGPLLAKMGVRDIHIWDDDHLEMRNCPTELAYSIRMVGQFKVDAMAQTISYLLNSNPPDQCPLYNKAFFLTGTSIDDFENNDGGRIYRISNDLRVITHPVRVTAKTSLSGVVISGVDSMKSRKEIWAAVRESAPYIPLYIDGRSAGEDTAIFALSPFDVDDVDSYESWLFEDDEATPLQCGARNIGYISAYMAAEIACIVTRYQRSLPIKFYNPHNFEQS